MLKPAVFRNIREGSVAPPDYSPLLTALSLPLLPLQVTPLSPQLVPSRHAPPGAPSLLSRLPFIWKVPSPHAAPQVAAHSSPFQAVCTPSLRQDLIPHALSAHGLKTLHLLLLLSCICSGLKVIAL